MGLALFAPAGLLACEEQKAKKGHAHAELREAIKLQEEVLRRLDAALAALEARARAGEPVGDLIAEQKKAREMHRRIDAQLEALARLSLGQTPPPEAPAEANGIAVAFFVLGGMLLLGAAVVLLMPRPDGE
jgi:hypothetical protein